ncbi:hypothetical protein OH738_10750 [Streptomyces hirsutus]|uniref:Uncharacterized protein n=1 Tax=Streptomyces hirsutus TaxID=35620 RepID=A0ABZ1GVJ4_9ACTN|nr:hypothetical protein [Streptomyces hirsutus]WSD09332.1 hypothetical protein OIE73_28725 [Streptomyces hirsutus]WTD17218.1 hypothetical protein OH738_10750 [Streptomyces hirsutus]
MGQTVWMTAEGDRYHAREDCRGLVSGQQGGEAQGFELRPVEQLQAGQAEQRGKTACGICGGSEQGS